MSAAAASSLTARLSDPTLLRTESLIGGVWTPADDRFEVTNPSTGEILVAVANCGAEATQVAVDAAERALPAWRARPAKERAALLMRWFTLMNEHRQDLASILTSEQGKPLTEALGEVTYGASFFEWFAEEARRAYGEVVPTHDRQKRLLAIRQPIGVCAAITPWNFPIAMITRKLGPALAAGCTVVVKPAGLTPLSALALAELGLRAGVPAGVINVVTAIGSNSGAVGRVLCESPVVRHLSFTGSTEVGRLLMKQCAPTVKKLALELGGNAPFVVFDDADLESAVEGAIASKFRNAGQTCVCANRFYVQSGIYDRFVQRLAARVSNDLCVGDGFTAGVNQGPLIDAAALAKVEEHVADAVGKGASVLAGGRRVDERFFAPTVLSGVRQSMLCTQEETFGPVAPVVRFETEEEAIALANSSEYGLASYLFTRDIGRIFRVGEALESGMVGINTGLISTAEVPFGGVKQSGLGREGGRQGLDEYLETKYLCLGDIHR